MNGEHGEREPVPHDEEMANLYALLDRVFARRDRWKALARRLREQRNGIAGMYAVAAFNVEALKASRAKQYQSHARELMESAARCGEAIERLQRERDNLVARLAASTEVRNSILTELEQEQGNSKTANHLVGWYMAERDEFRKDLAQEREAHTATKDAFQCMAARVRVLEKERDATARDLAKGEP